MSPSPALGATAILLAGVVLSFSGLIVRHIEAADDWQIVFYRSLVVAISLTLLMILRDRLKFILVVRRSGWAGLCAGLSIAVSMVTFVLAINATSVANTLFMLAAAPFLAAVLGWLLLRERLERATWVAMLLALGGVGAMVWHGVTGGSLFGNAMALLTALGFAGFSVALRFGRQTDMYLRSVLLGMRVPLRRRVSFRIQDLVLSFPFTNTVSAFSLAPSWHAVSAPMHSGGAPFRRLCWRCCR